MSALEVRPPATLQRAQDALARGDWQGAVELLVAERGRRALTPGELDLLARAAYGAGELELAISCWEQVYAGRVAADDAAGAAATAALIAMYLLMDTGLMAPVRGWVSRGERLLDGCEETATHALLAMVRAYERFLCGDAVQARAWADRAVDAGLRQTVPVAAALGRVARARLVLLDGAVDEGLALLDEAAVSVMSGELDALATGMVYCEVICALQNVSQHDRAEQWTEAMERWRGGRAYGGIHGRCRVHRAEILQLRGSFADAEEEALHACRELRPWMRREMGWPLTVLGTIRLRKGDLAGAEESFLAASEHGWEPQPGLALLRLAQGDADAAAASLADALERPQNVPWKERPPQGALRRAPLLEAQVQVSIVTGDVRTARTAATELSSIGKTFRSCWLRAAAALATGRVCLAEGDPGSAVAALEEAVALWTDLEVPYETASARSALAAAQQAAGHPLRAHREEQASAALLAQLGVAETTTRSLPVQRSRSASTTVFQLDGDTRCVAFAGRSVLLHDLKGMRYLSHLLAEPGREFHVLDLVARESDGGPRPVDDDLGPGLDQQARDAYRRRLREIDDDVEEARALGDDGRVALAQADREYLVRELARAFGLAGRHRPVSATSERARASTTRSLRYALARIGEHHPELGSHLGRTIRTGTYCAYLPDPQVPTCWQL